MKDCWVFINDMVFRATKISTFRYTVHSLVDQDFDILPGEVFYNRADALEFVDFRMSRLKLSKMELEVKND